MTDPVAGVVVVHFGDPEPTLRCLASLAADGSQIERRVVVVDNSGNMDPGSLGSEVMPEAQRRSVRLLTL